MQRKYFLAHYEGPKKAPRTSGFLGTFADAGFGGSSFVNPLHPQFSLKWVVTGPDAFAFDARLLPVKKGIRSRRAPRNQ
jgi:hypothetical protein